MTTTVELVDGSSRWRLQIESDPTSPAHHENRAAAGSTRSAIFMTWIGPRIGDDPDYGTPTMPAIAALEPDGTGSWYRLPEGWEVADSNIWGTLLMRSEGGSTQLAFFEPAN